MSTFGLSINQAMTVEKETTEEKAFSVCASTDKRKKVYNHRSIEIILGDPVADSGGEGKSTRAKK